MLHGTMWSIFFVVLTVAAVQSYCIESNFYYSEDCNDVGGFCLLKNECPYEVPKKHEALCSGQEGAICCKGFPQDDVNCYQSHNSCFKKGECPSSLDRGAKGCGEGLTCCTLI